VSAQNPSSRPRGVPAWVVLLGFVVLPVLVALGISRQAGARQVRRKAIASSHGWAVELKNEGRVVYVLRGFHRDRPFEAVQLLRGGADEGGAWRLRVPLQRATPSWVLVTPANLPLTPAQFGTITTLVTRTTLPPAWTGPPMVEPPWVVAGEADAVRGLLDQPVRDALKRGAGLPAVPAVSFVDSAVVLDQLTDLPEGEALIPYLDFGVGLVDALDGPDAGRP